MTQLTHLGQIVVTQTLFDTLADLGLGQDSTLRPLINRHAAGDWGDVCDEDRQLNEDAIKGGARTMSVYNVQPGLTIWVITEADRSTTTALLPEDY